LVNTSRKSSTQLGSCSPFFFFLDRRKTIKRRVPITKPMRNPTTNCTFHTFRLDRCPSQRSDLEEDQLIGLAKQLFGEAAVLLSSYIYLFHAALCKKDVYISNIIQHLSNFPNKNPQINWGFIISYVQGFSLTANVLCLFTEKRNLKLPHKCLWEEVELVTPDDVHEKYECASEQCDQNS
jgi:hypothetical protein